MRQLIHLLGSSSIVLTLCVTNCSFDQPYSPGEVELTPSITDRPPRRLVSSASATDLPRLTVPLDSPPTVVGEPRPSPRVRWPSDLSRHTSVKMLSPQTLVDHGAQDALTRALEAHSSQAEGSQERLDELSASEPPSTRASSDAGDADGERMLLLKEDMEIFVDPGETDGLPSTSTRSDAERNSKQAWNLVRSYTGGGFIRSRKTAARKAKQIAEEEQADKDEKEEKDGETKEGGYFVKMVKERNENVGGNPSEMGFGTTVGGGGGGILSSLMALQQHQQPEGATTPGGSSVASSRRNSEADYSSGSDDEDAGRDKFIAEQREKRRKNGWSGVASGVASGVTKSIAGLTGHAHKPASLEPHLATRRPLSNNSPLVQSTNSPPISPGWNSDTQSRPEKPTRPRSLFGESTHQIKKLGEKLADLEPSRSRPTMARSGAGVLGALVASTVS